MVSFSISENCRILQEFLSNVIKHARATKLFVLLEYKETTLQVTVKEDGVGFEKAEWLSKHHPKIKIHALSMEDDEHTILKNAAQGRKRIFAERYPSRNLEHRPVRVDG